MSAIKGRNVLKIEEKPKIVFVPNVDETIKDKLYSIANKGYGTSQPKIITIEEIENAISKWKLDNQIYSQDISLSNCLELSLSFQKILHIANLENLVKLEKLKLDNNMIMKIVNLESLVNIKWLDLSFNYIKVVEGLSTLINLEDLSLYSNQLTELSGLDNCRKLNVLSIGRNNINDPKGIVTYLRKFPNLLALNVHDNPFCKEDISIQFSFDHQINQKNIYYPSSYDVIFANLDKLKYLDWKPIDEEKKFVAIQNYKNHSQKDRDENYIQDEEKQQQIAKAYQELKHANSEAVLDFWQHVEKKIQSDISVQGGWQKLKKLPGLEDKLLLVEKLVEEILTPFKKEILIKQDEKDKLIKRKNKEIQMGHEKFVEMSKSLISNFKREFKKKTLGIKPENISKEKIESEIKSLISKLLEIEITEKQAMASILRNFQVDLKSKDNDANNETTILKEKLDGIKKTFRNHIQQVKDELDALVQPYIDIKTEEIPEEMRDLFDAYNDNDIQSDFERFTDIYEEKKETLDSSRTAATNIFYETLIQQEFTRNKKRLDDINEISNMYYNKLIVALGGDPNKN